MKNISKEMEDKLESIFGGKDLLTKIEALRSLVDQGENFQIFNFGLPEWIAEIDKKILVEIDRKLESTRTGLNALQERIHTQLKDSIID